MSSNLKMFMLSRNIGKIRWVFYSAAVLLVAPVVFRTCEHYFFYPGCVNNNPLGTRVSVAMLSLITQLPLPVSLVALGISAPKWCSLRRGDSRQLRSLPIAILAAGLIGGLVWTWLLQFFSL